MTSTETASPAPAPPAASLRGPWLRVGLVALVLGAWGVYLAVGLKARLGLSAVALFATGAAVLWAILWLYRTLVAVTVDPPVVQPTRLGSAGRRELLRDKRILLKALKELEFDHAMGKLSAADFEEVSARYRARALVVMRRLDEGAVTYRELIDRELRRRLGEPAPVVTPAARLCSACARQNDDDAVFCKSCGTRLAEVAS